MFPSRSGSPLASETPLAPAVRSSQVKAVPHLAHRLLASARRLPKVLPCSKTCPRDLLLSLPAVRLSSCGPNRKETFYAKADHKSRKEAPIKRRRTSLERLISQVISVGNTTTQGDIDASTQ